MLMPFLLKYSLISSGITTARSFLEHILRSGERKSQSEESYLNRLKEIERKSRLDEQAQERGHRYRIEETFLSSALHLHREIFIT